MPRRRTAEEARAAVQYEIIRNEAMELLRKRNAYEYYSSLPALHVGHTHNLVRQFGPIQIWVSRLTPEDYEGMPNPNAAWRNERLIAEIHLPFRGVVGINEFGREVY
jgi:hypothetical protein